MADAAVVTTAAETVVTVAVETNTLIMGALLERLRGFSPNELDEEADGGSTSIPHPAIVPTTAGCNNNSKIALL